MYASRQVREISLTSIWLNLLILLDAEPMNVGLNRSPSPPFENEPAIGPEVASDQESLVSVPSVQASKKAKRKSKQKATTKKMAENWPNIQPDAHGQPIFPPAGWPTQGELKSKSGLEYLKLTVRRLLTISYRK
jgi:hypothetical protein